MNKKIKTIYTQLIRLEKVVPTVSTITDATVWEQFNSCMEDLYLETNDIWYKDNKISPRNMAYGIVSVTTMAYKNALATVIGKLMGEFDLIEESSVSNGHTFNISQNQQVTINMIFEFQDLIDNKLNDNTLSPEEKSFLEKVKAGIRTATSYVSVIALVMRTAKECSLDLYTVLKLFT